MQGFTPGEVVGKGIISLFLTYQTYDKTMKVYLLLYIIIIASENSQKFMCLVLKKLRTYLPTLLLLNWIPMYRCTH